MKKILLIIAICTVSFNLATTMVFANDSKNIKDNNQSNTSKAIETTKEVTEKTVEATKRGYKKSVEATKNVTDKTVEATKKGYKKTVEVTKDATDKTVEATKKGYKKTVEATKDFTDKTVDNTKELIENINPNKPVTLEELKYDAKIKTLKNERKEIKAAYNSRIKDLKAKIKATEKSTNLTDVQKQHKIHSLNKEKFELEQERDTAIKKYTVRINTIKNEEKNKK